MKKENHTLYLIDGNSYIYRAFYAIRGLSTSKGFPTNAVYGFTNMLMKVVNEKKPDYLAVAFDPKGPTTRHEAFTEYKATRPPMPDGLIPQISYIHRIVEAMGVPVLLMEGIEADDVIAAVARKAEAKGLGVTVVTGDKDLFQLINDSIRVYDTMKDEVYGKAECEEKFGVPPDKIAEVLGLTGDTSDNIPGVPGIGPKTAVQLIKEYGTIENLLANIDALTKPKLKEALKEHAEDARLSRRLVELMTELPEDVDIEGLRRRPQDSRALIELFKELEFTALLKFVAPGEAPEVAYTTVTDERLLRKLAAGITGAGETAVTAAATSMLPMAGEPAGVALCLGAQDSYYVPFGHVERNDGELLYRTAPDQLPVERVVEILRPVFEDERIKKYGHNVKYDMIVLKNMGIELRGADFDSMLASYLLNPGRASHDLESVALEYMSVKKMPLSEAAGSGAKQVPYSQVDIEKATRYSAEHAYLAWNLSKILREKLEKEDLLRLFMEIELPLIPVLAGMERNGVYVDTDYLREMSKEISVMLESIIKDIYALAGGEFNINSPKQLAYVLFEKLKLTPVKKTKSGYSTDEEVLTTLAASHALPAEILNYRELFKLKSTYVDALSKLVNPRTGRVHTSLNQAVAATGRLSSSEPNLQNIPIRGDLGGRIRKAFAAPKGGMIISADYSQVELRIMAHLAGDASFIESFRKGEDVHTRTACEIFGVSPEGVTSDMRRKAKAVNFGIMYGISPYGLSVQIGVHPREAGQYIDAYFERHTGVKEYIEKNLEEVKKKGYATTIFGRKRPIPELNSDNRATRGLGERLAVNTPIQGSAADLIKVAMINIARRLKDLKLETLMILQVHDELVFEAPVGELDRVSALVKEEMEGVIKLDVPIKVDIGSGPNWGAAH